MPILPLFGIGVMVYALAVSDQKLRTLLYGLVALAATLGGLFGMTKALSLDERIMGHVAFAVMSVVPAFIMWTTRKRKKEGVG